MSEITEFVTFTPHTTPSPSLDLSPVTTPLKSTQGLKALYHGPSLESPQTHLLVILWSSHDAFTSFASSEAYTPWLSEFKALASQITFYQARLATSATTATALDAPCTEVIVAYGVEKPAFAENLGEFSTRMTKGGEEGKLKGWHANAWGEVTTPIAKEWGGEVKDAATLLVGWDSMEEHMEARAGPGPIMDNIELIRQARESMVMYHVNLKKL